MFQSPHVPMSNSSKEEMNLIHYLECERKTGEGEYDGKENAEIIIDEQLSDSIDFQVSQYLIEQDGSRNAYDLQLHNISRRRLERFVEILSDWFESDVNSSVSFSFEVDGHLGKRGDLFPISEVIFSINERGIAFIDGEARYELPVPAGTEKNTNTNEYNNIYNIKEFKNVMEEFLYNYGRDSQSVLDTGSFTLSLDELDAELKERCISKYDRGEYPDAAKAAGQLLEERLREKSPDNISDIDAPDFIRRALKKNGGSISFGERDSEKEGVMFLYSGFYQALRSPLHHRTPDPNKQRFLDNFGKTEAHNLICTTNLLLSLLENNVE